MKLAHVSLWRLATIWVFAWATQEKSNKLGADFIGYDYSKGGELVAKAGPPATLTVSGTRAGRQVLLDLVITNNSGQAILVPPLVPYRVYFNFYVGDAADGKLIRLNTPDMSMKVLRKNELVRLAPANRISCEFAFELPDNVRSEDVGVKASIYEYIPSGADGGRYFRLEAVCKLRRKAQGNDRHGPASLRGPSIHSVGSESAKWPK